MLPAEIQRVVLLICLAATGYLLILAWNEDMQETRDQDFYAAEPQIMATEPVADASFNDDSDTPTLAVSYQPLTCQQSRQIFIILCNVSCCAAQLFDLAACVQHRSVIAPTKGIPNLR